MSADGPRPPEALEPLLRTKVRHDRVAWFGLGLAAGLIVLVSRVRGQGWVGWTAGLTAAALALRLLAWPRVRWIAFGLGTTAPALCIAVLLAGPGWLEQFRRRDFDAGAWRAAAGTRSQERLRMVDALLASNRLPGLSESSVLAVLGPDDSDRGTGWGAGYFRDWDLVYWLGPERSLFRIDSEWLVIRLDGARRVRQVRLVRD